MVGATRKRFPSLLKPKDLVNNKNKIINFLKICKSGCLMNKRINSIFIIGSKSKFK